MAQEKLCNMRMYMYFIYVYIYVYVFIQSYICIEGEWEQRKMGGSLLANKANA